MVTYYVYNYSSELFICQVGNNKRKRVIPRKAKDIRCKRRENVIRYTESMFDVLHYRYEKYCKYRIMLEGDGKCLQSEILLMKM